MADGPLETKLEQLNKLLDEAADLTLRHENEFEEFRVKMRSLQRGVFVQPEINAILKEQRRGSRG